MDSMISVAGAAPDAVAGLLALVSDPKKVAEHLNAIKAAKDELAAKEVALAAERADLDKRAESIAQRTVDINSSQANLETNRASHREEVAQQKAIYITLQQQQVKEALDLANKDADLKKREAALRAADATIQTGRDQLNIDRAIVERRGESLDAREHAIIEREAAVQKLADEYADKIAKLKGIVG